MKRYTKRAGNALSIFILALFACLGAEAQNVATYGPYGPTIIGVGTNAIFTNSTWTFPASVVSSNVVTNNYSIPVTYTTNITTNVYTGLIDNTKESTLAVQVGFVTPPGITNTNTVIWEINPSMDGINVDTGNHTFWITNYSTSNSPCIFTTNFSSLLCGGIGYFQLSAIVNNNTNLLYPALTNTSGTSSNYIQIGAKKILIP